MGQATIAPDPAVPLSFVVPDGIKLGLRADP
jgi:hypothetical protein